MVQLDGFAQIAVGIHFRSQLATGIDDERQVHLVRGGELLGVSTEGLWRDVQLVFEDVVAEFVAQLLGMGIEEARHHGRLIGPVVHRQGEVVADYRDLVSLGSLLHQRRGTAAHGALQIFKYHNRHLRAFGRAQH